MCRFLAVWWQEGTRDRQTTHFFVSKIGPYHEGPNRILDEPPCPRVEFLHPCGGVAVLFVRGRFVAAGLDAAEVQPLRAFLHEVVDHCLSRDQLRLEQYAPVAQELALVLVFRVCVFVVDSFCLEIEREREKGIVIVGVLRCFSCF